MGTQKPKTLEEIFFDNTLFEFARSFETRKAEEFKPKVYADGRGIPTIGHGTALIFDYGDKWRIRNDLDKIIPAAGIKIGNDQYIEDRDRLDKIAGVLSNPKMDEAERVAEAKRLVRERDFNLIVDAPQARKLYDIGMRDALGKVERRLDDPGKKKKRKKGKPGTYAKLKGRHELIALADAAYNGEGLLKDELVGHVVEEERQKAFYFIAYKMRSGDKDKLEANKGWVTRSYKEAYMYGWFAGEKPTEAEIRALEEIYENNKASIDDYDKKWGEKLNRDIKGWVPFAELIRLAKEGKVAGWARPSLDTGVTSALVVGVSNEQISMMQEFNLPGSRPQQLGVSAYLQNMLRYSGGGSDAPLKNVCDPYESIKSRYGGN